jgi:sugar O-acyltransferase (sialic acid O-acetyltransferase NeuD family)
MRPIVIVGAGGHGRVVLDMCRALGRPVAGFLDDGRPTGSTIEEVPVLGDSGRLEDPDLLRDHAVVLAFGIIGEDPVLANRRRRELGDRLLARGGELATVVHPSVVVSSRAEIGVGTTVSSGAVIVTGARIGRNCMVHTVAIVDHDCVVEHGAQVGPMVTLCGGSRCREDSFLGVGVSVRPGLTVGARTRVGMQAGVLTDLPADVLAWGTPARPVEGGGRPRRPWRSGACERLPPASGIASGSRRGQARGPPRAPWRPARRATEMPLPHGSDGGRPCRPINRG